MTLHELADELPNDQAKRGSCASDGSSTHRDPAESMHAGGRVDHARLEEIEATLREGQRWTAAMYARLHPSASRRCASSLR